MSIKRSVHFSGAIEIRELPCPVRESTSTLLSPWKKGKKGAAATWYSPYELRKQFDADIKNASGSGAGACCLRGLEHQICPDRRAFMGMYVRSVVRLFQRLKKAARQGKEVNVEEGVHRYAATYSRESRARAKTVALSDQQDALEIHAEDSQDSFTAEEKSESTVSTMERRRPLWRPRFVEKRRRIDQDTSDAPVASWIRNRSRTHAVRSALVLLVS